MRTASNTACFAWELPPSASAARHDKQRVTHATQLRLKRDQSSPRIISNLSLCLTLGKGHRARPGILAVSVLLKKIWPPPCCLSPSLLPDLFAQRAAIPLNPKQLHVPSAHGLGRLAHFRQL